MFPSPAHDYWIDNELELRRDVARHDVRSSRIERELRRGDIVTERTPRIAHLWPFARLRAFRYRRRPAPSVYDTVP